MTKFEEPILEVVRFSTPDVLTTSTGDSYIDTEDNTDVSDDVWATAFTDSHFTL